MRTRGTDPEPGSPISFGGELAGDDEETVFLRQVSTALWTKMCAVFELRELVVPSLTVTVTDDIMGSAADECVRLGLPPDWREGEERLGGIVAGKTLVNEAGDEAVVLLHRAAVAPVGDPSRLWTTQILAHEFAHILYGAARIDAVGSRSSGWLPWEVAEVIALLAAEEYRCDQIAHVLVAQTIRATDEEGEPVSLELIEAPDYASSLLCALDAISPGLEDTILQYRTRGMSLEDMWDEVQTASEQIAIAIAHTEAHHNGDERLLPTLDHPAVSILEPIAGPLVEHLPRRPGSLSRRTGEWTATRLPKWADRASWQCGACLDCIPDQTAKRFTCTSRHLIPEAPVARTAQWYPRPR